MYVTFMCEEQAIPKIQKLYTAALEYPMSVQADDGTAVRTFSCTQSVVLCLPASDLQPHFPDKDFLKTFLDIAKDRAGFPLTHTAVLMMLNEWYAGNPNDALSPSMYLEAFSVASVGKVLQRKTSTRAGPDSMVKQLSGKVAKTCLTTLAKQLFPSEYPDF